MDQFKKLGKGIIWFNWSHFTQEKQGIGDMGNVEDRKE